MLIHLRARPPYLVLFVCCLAWLAMYDFAGAAILFQDNFDDNAGGDGGGAGAFAMPWNIEGTLFGGAGSESQPAVQPQGGGHTTPNWAFFQTNDTNGSGINIDTGVATIADTTYSFGFLTGDKSGQSYTGTLTAELWDWNGVGGLTTDGTLIGSFVAGNASAGTPVISNNMDLTSSSTTEGNLHIRFDVAANGTGFQQPLIDNVLLEAGGSLDFTIDRADGSVSITNLTGASVTFIGYSLLSGGGALNPNGWNSIASTSDMDSGGSVDPDDNWTELVSSSAELGELEIDNNATAGNGATLADGASLTLGNAWKRNPIAEDVTLEFLLADGTLLTPAVEFIGDAVSLGDLVPGDGINAADWQAFRAAQGSDFTGLSAVEAYFLGDLDGDFDHDIDDFIAFRSAFDAANGLGAFSAMLASVPEPASALLSLFAGLLLAGVRFRVRWPISTRCILLVTLTLGISSIPHFVQAQAYFENFEVVGPNGSGTGDAVLGDYSARLLDGPLFGGAGVEDDANAPGDPNRWLFFQTGNANMDDSTVVIDTGVTGVTGTEYIVTYNAAERLDAVGFDQILNVRLYASTDSLANFNEGAATLIGSHVATTTNGDATLGEIFPNQFMSTAPTITGNLFLVFDAQSDATTFQQALVDDISLDFPGSTPTELDLIVNTVTGNVMIENNTGSPVDFNAYEVTSASGALQPGQLSGDFDSDGDVDGTDFLGIQRAFGTSTDASDIADWGTNYGGSGSSGGWNSLQDQDLAGFPAGDGTGNGWEEGDNPSANELVEYFLGDGNGPSLDSSTLVAGGSLDLGTAFSTAVGTQDLVFRYSVPGVGSVATSPTYVSSLGATATVPEPTTLVLLLLSGIAMSLSYTRRTPSVLALAAIALLFTTGGSVATAASTLDRNYQFGDDAAEGTFVDGTVVGQAAGNVLAGFSLDSIGQPTAGNFQDIENTLGPSNGPVYRNLTSTRPLADATEIGIEFDGVDDFLRGIRLGGPASSEPAIEGLDGLTPEDYSGISNRGFQLWVNPGSTAVDQFVVLDTNEHGVGISFDEDNGGTTVWSLVYSNTEVIPDRANAAAAVTQGQWTHIMVVRPFGDFGLASGSMLYVDGVAVSALAGGYNQASDVTLTIGASNDESPTNFFSGQIDDLEMFVLGTSTDTETEYGIFNAGQDNAFIADAVSGFNLADINLSGAVDAQDVSDFVTNWRSVRAVNGVRVGDLVSRAQGDLNFDGVVNYQDAFLFHEALPAAGFAAGLDFSLLGVTVPEPSSFLLLALGGVFAASFIRSGKY